VLKQIHNDWAFVVAAANLIVGGWGVYMWRKQKIAPKQFWYALGGAWISIYIQGILGLAIFHKYPHPLKHTFYGFLFVVITLAIFPLRSEEKPRTRLAAFAWATLFIGIVAIRAIVSGHGA
jgi:drug/metabolite transporter superfamily protein YnfA